MADRRTLKFDTLADAVRDAENLLVTGYDKVGNWDLAQCCGHLRHWMSYPLDGYPRSPLLFRPLFWVMRNTFAPRMFRKAIAKGDAKAGMPTIPDSVPTSGQEAAPAVAALRDAVERWTAHTGPLHPSPLFGRLSKDEWTAGHRIHAAHHLGFLVPKGG